jgi:hypothetical protein
LATAAIAGASGTNPFISSSSYVVLGDADGAVISAEQIGVKASGLDSDADANSTALQRACDYAAALGGGIVQLPIGNIRFNGGLTLGQGVVLTGTGRIGTVLQAAFGSNSAFLVANKVAANSSGQNAMLCGLMNLVLDGRKDNQTSGTGYGVYFRTNPTTTIAAGDTFFDPQHVLFNVRVYKSYGDAFRFEGRSAIQGNLLMAQTCGGWGFWSSFDTNLGYAESNQCGLGGFHFDNGSIRVSVAKAYLSGQGTGTPAPGFYFGSNCYSFTGSALEAQNNTGAGYQLVGCKGVALVGAAAESNWTNDAGTGAGTQGAGFVLDGAVNCTITGVSTQSKQNSVQVGNQLNAARLVNGATNNELRLTHVATAAGITMASPLTGDSVTSGNSVSANGSILAPLVELQTNKGQVGGYASLDGTGKVPAAQLPAATINPSFGSGFFGDGSDGVVDLDGTNTFASFTTKSGSTYTLTRPVFATTLTVGAGVTLVSKGFIVYANAVVAGTGTIQFNGLNATSSSAGFAAIPGSGAAVQGGTAAGAGATGAGAAGTNNNTNQALGGAGGASGAGGTGASAAGGTASTPTASFLNAPRSLPWAAQGLSITGTTAFATFAGGSGGGGGGGDGTNAGGGGGGGAGVVIVNAKTVSGSLTVQANGGNGFTPTVGNTGGGGGGGGGVVIVNTTAATGLTVQANGGSPGRGNGTGATGTAGSAGRTYVNQWS